MLSHVAFDSPLKGSVCTRIQLSIFSRCDASKSRFIFLIIPSKTVAGNTCTKSCPFVPFLAAFSRCLAMALYSLYVRTYVRVSVRFVNKSVIGPVFLCVN